MVCRVYDAMGGKSKGVLVWGVLPVEKVTKCNVLEDDEDEIQIASDGKGIEIEIRAFEVATFRLQLRDAMV